MKSKLAQMLRKWADLIAPCVKPIDEITIRTYVDPRDAAKAGEFVKLAAQQSLADRIVEDRCGNRRLRRPVGYVRSTLTDQVQRQEWPAKAE
jgi:hypothetical protein